MFLLLQVLLNPGSSYSVFYLFQVLLVPGFFFFVFYFRFSLIHVLLIPCSSHSTFFLFQVLLMKGSFYSRFFHTSLNSNYIPRTSLNHSRSGQPVDVVHFVLNHMLRSSVRSGTVSHWLVYWALNPVSSTSLLISCCSCRNYRNPAMTDDNI